MYDLNVASIESVIEFVLVEDMLRRPEQPAMPPPPPRRARPRRTSSWPREHAAKVMQVCTSAIQIGVPLYNAGRVEDCVVRRGGGEAWGLSTAPPPDDSGGGAAPGGGGGASSSSPGGVFSLASSSSSLSSSGTSR